MAYRLAEIWQTSNRRLPPSLLAAIMDESWWRRQEREADEFAAYLLMPEEELRKLKVHVKFIVSELQNKDC